MDPNSNDPLAVFGLKSTVKRAAVFSTISFILSQKFQKKIALHRRWGMMLCSQFGSLVG